MARIELKAEVTGKVWKIEALLGAKVDANEPLMIVESMKMEIPLASPQAGTVKEIRVAESDMVDEDQVLLIIG